MKRIITLLLTLCILLSSVVTINALEIPYTEMETVGDEDREENELQPLAADDGCDEDGDGIPDDEEDDGTMGGMPSLPGGGGGSTGSGGGSIPTIQTSSLTQAASTAYNNIKQGYGWLYNPHTYANVTAPYLPNDTTYTTYWVNTTKNNQRIVKGANGLYYYSPDHYKSWYRIK